MHKSELYRCRSKEIWEKQTGNLHPIAFAKKCGGCEDLIRRLKLYTKLDWRDGCVNTVHFNPSGDLLVSGSDHTDIVIWDWGAKKLSSRSGHEANVFQARIMPLSDDRSIVSSAADGQVRHGELSKGGKVTTKKLAKHRGHAHKLAIDAESPRTFFGRGEDGVVQQFDLREEKSTELFDCFSPAHLIGDDSVHITCVAYSQEEELLASYNDELVYMFDKELGMGPDPLALQKENRNSSGENIQDPKPQVYIGNSNARTVKGVNFSGPNTEDVVSGSDCRWIYIWRKSDGKLVNILHGESHVVTCLEPHPFMTVLATSGIERNLKIWTPTSDRLGSLPLDASKTLERNRRQREEGPYKSNIEPRVIMHVMRLQSRDADRDRDVDSGEFDFDDRDHENDDSRDSSSGRADFSSREPEGSVDSKPFENSFNNGSQNGTIVEGKRDPELGLCATASIENAEPHNGKDHLLQSSEVQGISKSEEYEKLKVCDPQFENSQSHDNNRDKLPHSAAAAGEANLTPTTTSSMTGAGAGSSVEDTGRQSDRTKVKEEEGVKVSDNGISMDGISLDDKKSFGEEGKRSLRTEVGGTNGEIPEKLCANENGLQDRARAGCDMNGDRPEESSDVGNQNGGAAHFEGNLSDTLGAHQTGHGEAFPHRTSDAGVSFDGKNSEKSFSSAVSWQGDHHHRHRRGSGGKFPNPASIERLYNPPHICNHVRCAANNQDYAMRQMVAPKKYLVAKKHVYVSDKSRRTSCDHDGGSRRISCDHDKSYALHSGGAGGDKSRRASADPDKTRAINNWLAGKSRRTSVDQDRKDAHITSGAPHHKRGKSTPSVGFTPPGAWNASVAIDKKPEVHGFWSTAPLADKKHGGEHGHGVWNNSVAVDKKHEDHGPWNGSVAIDKKLGGERRDKPRSNHPGAAKHSTGSSKADLSNSSRRTSNESSIRRSLYASEVAVEDRNGNANGHSETPYGEDGRRQPRNDDGSPSASVGSNRTDQSSSKEAVLWQRLNQNSPDSSSCVTSDHSPSCESLASIIRSDSRVATRARYELPTLASKLPKLSSHSPSESTTGSGPSKPSWNSSTSKVVVISATPPSVGSIATTSTLARTFITKLKKGTKTVTSAAVAKAPSLPSWNSSITVAPNLFDYSTTASGASKMVRKFISEMKQSSKAQKAIKGQGAEGKETDDKAKSDSGNSTSENSATAMISSSSEMSVPISESSVEKHVDPGFPNPSTPISKLTRYDSMREGSSIPTPNKFTKVPSMKEKESKIPGTLKFGKRERTWFEEAKVKNETVSLKKGETAERRLSEEYMTDHTLTTIVPRDIQGGRVKSLVNAFESLKTGPDVEHHHSNDETVKAHYQLELASLSPSPIAT